MPYTPTTWVNGSGGGTPLSAANLNNIEDGIVDLETSITALSAAAVTRYRKTTVKTVNTTTSPTDLLNGEITIGAGVMSTNKAVTLRAWGDWKQNSGGAAAAPRLQLVLGASTLLDTGTAGTCTNAATRYGWRLCAEIMNLGSASVQLANLLFHISCSMAANGETAFTTGEGVYDLHTAAVLAIGKAEGYNAGAVDTSSARALVLNVINGSANANYETKLFGAQVVVE